MHTPRATFGATMCFYTQLPSMPYLLLTHNQHTQLGKSKCLLPSSSHIHNYLSTYIMTEQKTTGRNKGNVLSMTALFTWLLNILYATCFSLLQPSSGVSNHKIPRGKNKWKSNFQWQNKNIFFTVEIGVIRKNVHISDSTHAEECILSFITGNCYMQKIFSNIMPVIKFHIQNLNRSTGYRNFIIRAGLILRQEDIPEKMSCKLKSCKWNIKFSFKTVYFLGLGVWPHSIQCMTKPLVDIWTYRVKVWLYSRYYQSIHVTDGVIVTPLTDSLQHNITATMYCVCHITLNRKLSCIIYAKSR